MLLHINVQYLDAFRPDFSFSQSWELPCRAQTLLEQAFGYLNSSSPWILGTMVGSHGQRVVTYLYAKLQPQNWILFQMDVAILTDYLWLPWRPLGPGALSLDITLNLPWGINATARVALLP